MEKLSRRDLQKICQESRASGKIPKEARCNGKTSELVKLLEESPTSSSQPKGPSLVAKKRPTYNISLRGLASYLTYDKLLLIIAHYPKHPLLEELRSSKGKIWSDRVWVEIGEPPIDLNPGGFRYYQQWLTNKFLHYGKIAFGDILLDKECLRASSVWQHRSSGSFFVIWVITRKGLEVFALRHNYDPFIHTARLSKELWLLDKLKDPANWTLAVPGDFIYLDTVEWVFEKYQTVFQNKKGDLYQITWNVDITQGKIPKAQWIQTGVRYIRKSSLGRITTYYTIDVGGDHVIRDKSGTETNYGATPGSRHSPLSLERKVGEFEQYHVSLTDPRQNWTIDGSYGIKEDPYGRKLEKDKIYLLPSDDLVRIFYEATGTFPRGSFKTYGHAGVLATNGILYEDNTNYPGWERESKVPRGAYRITLRDKYSEYQVPGRLQTLDGISVGAGASWFWKETGHSKQLQGNQGGRPSGLILYGRR